MVIYNDGPKLKASCFIPIPNQIVVEDTIPLVSTLLVPPHMQFLDQTLKPAAVLPLDGAVTTILNVGLWVFSAYTVVLPGVAAVSMGQLKACWMRPGAEPVQWSMTVRAACLATPACSL